ncbi:DUF4291 family protein [Pseudoalteromonas sp. SMS1]|nr:DUF4291 family protein [Pseudoalteromonas sp. SMS1]
MGITNEAVNLYVNQWIKQVTDVTELATKVKSLVDSKQYSQATSLLPIELPYLLSQETANKIGAE